MRIFNKTYAVVAASLALVGPVGAEELIADPYEPVAVSTSPAVMPVVVDTTSVISPVAVTTAPAITPVAVSTGATVVAVDEIAVVIPADANRTEDVVAWKKLEGTVQSVDRANLAMTVQDREGKDIRVVFNDRMRIFRSGEPIAYSDVEPNDRVVLRYGREAERVDN